VDLREEFVLQAKEPGANVAELCREHGISRKTGYKWLLRFDALGVQGLRDMSRRPRRPVQTSGEIVLRVQEQRRAHLRWGPKKLRVLLLREFAQREVPSVKTIARILERLGEPKLRRARRRPPLVQRAVPDATVTAPNDLWTVDFKGWWKTRNGERCEPLTVRDAFSRFVLCMKVLASPARDAVRTVFERLFQQWGLPRAIQVDNGSPFGCTRARAGLTQLSAWWIALGIKVIFGRPGHPEDNGAHERLHGDMRFELEDPSSETRETQQSACDLWVDEFNQVRPHEALQMRTPSELYARSPRPYRGKRPARYPGGFDVRPVAWHGAIKYANRLVYVGGGYAGFSVGVERLRDPLVRLWFYELDLGEVDLSSAPLQHRRHSEPAAAAKTVPRSSRAAGKAHGRRSSSRTSPRPRSKRGFLSRPAPERAGNPTPPERPQAERGP